MVASGPPRRRSTRRRTGRYLADLRVVGGPSASRKSASGSEMAWFWPMGRSKTTRWLAYANGAMQGDAADAERLGGEQDAFRIEAVQQAAEAVARFADQVGIGDQEVAKKTSFEVTALRPSFGIGRMSTCGTWRSTRNSVMPSVRLRTRRAASCARAAGASRPRVPSCSRSSYHGCGSPVSTLRRSRRDARRIGAGIGLGDAERDVELDRRRRAEGTGASAPRCRG